MEPFKILLVDDDPDDHVIIREAMQNVSAGNLIHATENGLKALDILKECSEAGNLPGLIVLDLNMPLLSGTQVLGLLKKDERFRNIPVIIYSTSINPLEKDKCMLLGAHSYITKPISHKQSIEIAQVFLQTMS